MNPIPSPYLARALATAFSTVKGTLQGGSVTTRRLSDLRGVFADVEAYEHELNADDAVIYTVESLEPGDGQGDLHFGIGRIMPGRVGNEYYMTKGHLHRWREAAEVYIGLSGTGIMLLEDEAGSESRSLPLAPNLIVYVPGYVAHRTINTGSEPLVYLGVFPAQAGHDYGAIAGRNFRMVVVDRDGEAVTMERART